MIIKLQFQRLIFLLFCLCFLHNSISAQLNYYPFDSLKVSRNGQLLKQPSQGGFNAPQFNQIDLNFDGKLDLLIFDRAGNRLTPMLNMGDNNEVDYQYAPEYIQFIPAPENQLYTRDFDCDGDMDVILGGSELRVYENQGSRAKGLIFQDSGKIQTVYSPEFPNPIASTLNPGQLNYIGLADVDGDSDMDIICEFGAGNQLEYHKNLSIEVNGKCGLLFERRAKCWGDFTESNLSSEIFLDSCRWGDFPNPEDDKGLKHGNASISIFDLDNNGSQDLVLGDDGTNRLSALFNDDTLSTLKTNSHIYKIDTLFPSYNIPVDQPTFSTAYFIDLNNDGIEDMVVSPNTEDFLSPAKGIRNIKYYKRDANTNLFELENNELFSNEILDFGEGSFPAFFDYNKDGKKDLVVGNYGYYSDTSFTDIGQLALLENTGTFSNPEFNLIDTNYLNIPSIRFLSTDTNSTYNIIPTFGDLNGDGREDLLIGERNGVINYFLDTATSGNASFQLTERNFQEVKVLGNAAPTLFDVNGDGLLDLIIGSNRGFLTYHENYGSTNSPIFNIPIQSIQWQFDSIVRLALGGSANLSKFTIGQTVKIDASTNPGNNLEVIISSINTAQNYIDVVHPFTRSNIDDELNSTAVVDYSLKQWGGIDLVNLNTNFDATPFLFKDKDDVIKMVIGTRKGDILLIDSVSNQKGDTFFILDSNYVSSFNGGNTALAGDDLNGDGLIDLVVGNKAGGISFYFGLNNVGIDENESIASAANYLLYPNPTNGLIRIEYNNQDPPIEKIELRDINGRKVNEYDANQRVFDLSYLPKGVYLFTIFEERQVSTSKIVLR